MQKWLGKPFVLVLFPFLVQYDRFGIISYKLFFLVPVPFPVQFKVCLNKPLK